jgi:hypothetical protein
MALIVGYDFDAAKCREFFARARFGHLGLNAGGTVKVVPVSYRLDHKGFLVGVSDDSVAFYMGESVVTLHAEGWHEDAGRRWTAQAVGISQPAHVEQERGPCPESGAFDREASHPCDEAHLFRLTPRTMSGGWVFTTRQCSCPARSDLARTEFSDPWSPQ